MHPCRYIRSVLAGQWRAKAALGVLQTPLPPPPFFLWKPALQVCFKEPHLGADHPYHWYSPKTPAFCAIKEEHPSTTHTHPTYFFANNHLIQARIMNWDFFFFLTFIQNLQGGGTPQVFINSNFPKLCSHYP